MLSTVALILGTAGCSPAPESRLATFSGDVMGTTYNVRIVSGGGGAGAVVEAEAAVAEAVDRVDDLMTTYRDSEVTRFNAALSTEPYSVSAETAEVTRVALELAAATDGALDVTIGPLVAAFGFGASGTLEIPDAERLAELQERVGYRRLTVDADDRLVKTQPEMALDLSSIAKGYAVDRAAAALAKFGFVDYMVELGGEVSARGRNELGQPWRIGVERPDAARGVVQRVIPLSDLAMATSGDYRQYREVDGKRVSHIIDPRSARPVEHRVASATVLHPSCATADGIATAMMVLGEDGVDLAESHGWAVLLLVRSSDGFREVTSPAFEALIDSG